MKRNSCKFIVNTNEINKTSKTQNRLSFINQNYSLHHNLLSHQAVRKCRLSTNDISNGQVALQVVSRQQPSLFFYSPGSCIRRKFYTLLQDSNPFCSLCHLIIKLTIYFSFSLLFSVWRSRQCVLCIGLYEYSYLTFLYA